MREILGFDADGKNVEMLREESPTLFSKQGKIEHMVILETSATKGFAVTHFIPTNPMNPFSLLRVVPKEIGVDAINLITEAYGNIEDRHGVGRNSMIDCLNKGFLASF